MGKIILRMESNLKYDIEPFDGKNNFNIWQSIIKDVMIQQRLLKALQGKKLESMTNKEMEELEARVSEYLLHASNMCNVFDMTNIFLSNWTLFSVIYLIISEYLHITTTLEDIFIVYLSFNVCIFQ